MWDVISRDDIVYTATSAVDYLVEKASLEANSLAGGKPLMLVDIAVPRNVGTDCNELRSCNIFFNACCFLR
jgi:glutamyl-tRNA reductase